VSEQALTHLKLSRQKQTAQKLFQGLRAWNLYLLDVWIPFLACE
jgi:hypothetical protein